MHAGAGGRKTPLAKVVVTIATPAGRLICAFPRPTQEQTMKYLLTTLALFAGTAMACPADDVKDAAAPASNKPVAATKAATTVAATKKATPVAADKATTKVADKSATEGRKASPL
jgi:hypothetical protein